MTTGWKISDTDRTRLLARFPPVYVRVIADHVTLHSTSAGQGEQAPPPVHGRVIGRVNDGAGVEALIVEIAGTTERPAGGHYHITWSLAEGRSAKESNDAIAHLGWEPADGGTIDLRPDYW